VHVYQESISRYRELNGQPAYFCTLCFSDKLKGEYPVYGRGLKRREQVDLKLNVSVFKQVPCPARSR